MGIAVAMAARDSGATVTLIHGPIAEAIPDGIKAIPIVSADDMYEAVFAHALEADAVFMAAAVADWRRRQSPRTSRRRRMDPMSCPSFAPEIFWRSWALPEWARHLSSSAGLRRPAIPRRPPARN